VSEVARIRDQLQRSWDGDAWHGPPLWPRLADVPASAANDRPIPGAHTIAEIVQHLSYWKDAVRRRLAGETVLPTEAEQWPAVPGPDEAAWQEALALLRTRHQALAEAVARLRDEQLADPVGGKDYDVYVLLHGAIQHDLYHTGQIALLKKATST
jgi:uncharacterized damage-inducible protein DinB